MSTVEHEDHCPDKGDRRCDCDWESRVRADALAPVVELLNTQRIQHAALIAPTHPNAPVLIEVDRVLALITP